jgi:ATP-dependent Lon protease
VVVLDEGQSIRFDNPREMAGLLKGYLEAGEYTRGNNKATADASLVILANIQTYDDRPMHPEFVRELPPIFHESAVLDRFHGIIPGWLVPRFTIEAAARGMGLKADFISEIFRRLRADIEHMDYVRKHTIATGDRRDVTAIERLASAFLKLYFPDLRVSRDEFDTFCLSPAISLRERIREQLVYVDPGSFADKNMGEVTVKPSEFASGH